MIYVLANGVCDNATMKDVMAVIKLLMNIICIIVPIIMIIMGTMDLFKAVTAGKDDDIKKKQQTLIKRIIAGVIVFLVPTIVSLLTGLIGVEEWKDCWNSTGGNIKDLFKDTVKKQNK